MRAPPLELLLAVLVGGFLLSSALVWVAVQYSRRRGLLDEPGRRRSHRQPTPRGGGVGIVAAFVVGLLGLCAIGRLPGVHAAAITGGVLLVAAIGWLDDHRPQSVARRLWVHGVAAALLLAGLFGAPASLGQWLWIAAGVFAVMTAINFSNFMDGSNGLLALQACAVALVLLVIGLVARDWTLLLAASLLLATVAGFLPFNFPRAQIFLGDVGSGALGLLTAALGLQAMRSGSLSAAELLALTSGVWLDAALTLGWRIFSGRRWYAAHREHLFQWLLRRGWSHARVAWLYVGWTLAVATPLVVLVRIGLIPELAAPCAVAVIGVPIWLLVRRRLLRRVPLTATAPEPSTS